MTKLMNNLGPFRYYFHSCPCKEQSDMVALCDMWRLPEYHISDGFPCLTLFMMARLTIYILRV